MTFFTNHSNEVVAAYVVGGISIITNILMICTQFLIFKKNSSNAIELEKLKQKFELSRVYTKDNIDHISQLLNYVYNIRINIQKVIQNGNDKNLVILLISCKKFERYYRSRAHQTNLLDRVVRSFTHDTIRYSNQLEQLYESGKRLENANGEGSYVTEVAKRFLSHVYQYEDILREDSKRNYDSILD